MLQTRPRKTIDDYMRLPVESGVELIHGEFVMSPSPTPRHQRTSRDLFRRIDAHVQQNRLGEAFFAPLDVVLSAETVVQPDIIFIATSHLGIVTDRIRGAPDLVIEILSATGQDRDRFTKLDLYRRHGITEYWIVDDAAHTIEVYARREGDLALLGVFETGDLVSSTALPGLSLRVGDVC